ncbi:energy transducer TonB family protein [Microvirga sp. CF3016]|uniref:energy transducer TonB family protein n=1 Tax=Microvirga sp. CF3016 TaxID=3110181 RepID=UPI002E776E74|nr:TonB family protein [Microvirga sp. CF3016]MEE1612524.1 TonB family protein [Microvirga sp. CF3016]
MLTAVSFWPSDAEDPPGEQEITIDLAPATEEVVSVAAAEMSAQAAPPVEEVQPTEPDTVEPSSPEEVVQDRPQDVAEASKPEPVTEAVTVEALPAQPEAEAEAVVALPPPEAVVAKPLEEKPAPKPEPKPEKKPPPKLVERKPPPRRTVAQQPQPPSEARQGQVSASRENMSGSAASADPDAMRRYRATLYAAVKNRLRYPPTAERQGISGTAEVRFTLDRSGQIISASLVRSSGNPLLDQAALATVRPGSSLPAAPASVPQSQFTVSAPLRFDQR